MSELSRKLFTPTLLAIAIVGGAASLLASTSDNTASAQQSTPALSTAQLNRLRQLAGDFKYSSGTSIESLRRSLAGATKNLETSVARSVRAQAEAMLFPSTRLRFGLENPSATGTRLLVRDGGTTVKTPLNGVLQGAQGRSAARVSQQLQSSVLVQTIENRGFRQERRFSLNATGTSITVSARLTGALLDAPVETQTVYQRL